MYTFCDVCDSDAEKYTERNLRDPNLDYMPEHIPTHEEEFLTRAQKIKHEFYKEPEDSEVSHEFKERIENLLPLDPFYAMINSQKE